MRIVGSIVAACAATLVLAAPAQAARGTYAGTITNTTGKIALDVKISKAGFVKKVTEIRVTDVPSTCEISGQATVQHTFPADLRVDQQTARYGGTYTQPNAGNQSRIDGKIKRRKTKGTIQIDYLYPPQGGVPEENCDTGLLAYKASLDNVDETVARPSARLRY